MDWRSLVLAACIGGLPFSASLVLVPNVRVSVEQPSTQLSEKQLQHLAQLMTVKVLSGDFLGSGILIHRQGPIYLVLTNAHVLRSGKPPYQIQTPDGRLYGVELSTKGDRARSSYFHGNDLALLQFQSPDATYTVGTLGSALDLNVGNEVFAAGFQFNPEKAKDIEFVFKTGKVSLILEKALEGGYRIGYTNDIQKGMSGGPLLNDAGEVIAINGMHSEPLWGNPYIYQDGTQPQPFLRQQMRQYSWGIPIDTFVQLVSLLFRATDSDIIIMASER